MKISGQRPFYLAVAGSLLLAATAWGDAKPNPYLSIVERNPFGLKPVPPPPEPQPNPADKKPAVQVRLTGITSILSKTKAIVEITEQGKPAKKPPPLSEGEGVDNVNVVSIDYQNKTVTFNIAGVTTNIGFELPKSGPAPAGAPTPGMPGLPTPGMPGVPRVPMTTAVPPPPAAAPIAVGAGAGSSGRGSGIVVVGNNSPAAPSATPTPFSAPGPTAVSAGVTLSDGTTGLRTIPQRVPRTAQPQTGNDPVIQYINLKASELKAQQEGRPHPPTPPIPGIE